MSRPTLILGTRGSKLALQQSQWVQARLHELEPDVTIVLQRIQTSGDRILDVPLAKIGGKGLFTKEIEEALLKKEIDFAVHSMKDVPTALPDGLEIMCVPRREDARDALITRDGCSLDALRQGAAIGTSSLRRQAQLLHYRPDFKIEMLRGNLDTRLRKLRDGVFDAIVLAAAGLNRLDWSKEITQLLPIELSLPAIGQGALGIEARSDDDAVRRLLQRFDDGETKTAVAAERALLHRLEGGCQVPIAAHATLQGDTLTLDGLVASVDGRRMVRHRIHGSAADASQLGTKLAEQLLADGADLILKEIYGQRDE
jgi:hydroxymethylbilane synthase